MRPRTRSLASRGRTFLHVLQHSPGLGRLLAVRLSSQITDGVFQAALVGGILFNPERHADPLAVAGGIAVLLLPYSMIGPFAGALLDHWDRRSVLMFANLVRALLICVVAGFIAVGAPEGWVLVGALAVTGASRFVASGLSAGLPHVVHREVIVATNALFTTLGAAMLAVGAGLVLALRALFGDDNSGSAMTMLGAVVIAVVAAAIARGFAHLQLGPDGSDDPGRSAVHAVSVGLSHGIRAVAGSRPVAAALTAIGTHRLVFGMNTLMLLVFMRHVDGNTGDGGVGDGGVGDGGTGLDGVALIATFTAAGAFLAALVTPVAVDHVGRRTTLMAALGIGALAQLSLATLHIGVFCAAALVLGLVGQVVKLCGDVAMQVDTDDAVRGQVFSVQDAIFNVAYVIAITLAAVLVADDGRSPGFALGGAALYLVGIALVRIMHAPRHLDTPRTGVSTGIQSGAKSSAPSP